MGKSRLFLFSPARVIKLMAKQWKLYDAMWSCQQHQNRPNPDSKKPLPTPVQGHTLSKGEASVAVHLMIKHIMIALTILTFIAILMIWYRVYVDNIKHDKDAGIWTWVSTVCNHHHLPLAESCFRLCSLHQRHLLRCHCYQPHCPPSTSSLKIWSLSWSSSSPPPLSCVMIMNGW